MKLSRKISLVWSSVVVFAVVISIVFPQRDFNLLSSTNWALMLLLAIVSFFIFLKEPVSRNKPIFLNFVIAFSVGSLQYLQTFVGPVLFSSEPYASAYFYQYWSGGLFFFLIAGSIVYVVMDTLFNDIRTYSKYLITLLVVGGVFAYYYHPILNDPLHIYKTADIADWKVVSKSIEELQASGSEQPTLQEISANVTLHAWKDGEKVGTLFEEQKLKRVAALLPYVEGNNYLVLLWKPLHLNVIYMNVLCVFAIFLFFGYQYRHDPPQGAYIEKIIFLFLPYCSLEILHFFGYIMSVEHATYLDYYQVGQYLSLFNIVLLLLFFSLRLSFITSIKGEFYEQELVSDSEHISRWRDGIDNLIVRHFLNPETFHGRLFTPRTSRKEA
jgi:hypothetical protein